MSTPRYQIRQCRNPECGLRFPLPMTDTTPVVENCPRCKGSTELILEAPLDPESGFRPGTTPPKAHLEVLLDNIRSAWNVGAIFRSADGLGIRRLHLCGITATPENEAVRKTALGAEQSIPWSYSSNSLEKARELKEAGAFLIALEQDERSIPLETIKIPEKQARVTLLVGNEITGVDPELLALCDCIANIPMYGVKRSLNVEVAFAIAAYQLAR